MNPVLTGLLAGFAATVPMTAVMEFLHRRLPWHERHPLPPHEITTEMAERIGIREHLDEPEHAAAAGAAYAPLAGNVPGSPALKGAAFGLIVWGASYLGWLPAADFLSAATKEPPRRNALMIIAHMVWGAILGLLVDRWERD
jgi:hypothetical protein